ncbi:MAG: hypothetical protein BGO45_05415 [Microbacterium sp. 71-36]|uniref:hypothetical protein n=1 Tax=unclassified Microbacterium TaxID=2609290 RepID=UPI00086C760B|nr:MULTISPECIES: hypothetical protein [unclassified Microbacterium]MBN9211302.1 hypothetical protein [Microbacterium sp.]ODT36601.1 MAG: hypothetical protein ABS60_15375 [Microbacterium sp. SCN 71-17]OJV75137.1 MAG: hypothetical protein BGO45_05415 [Microbacterium sp. 71-36]
MSGDDVELARLRERVYGGRGSAPTVEEIARLSALEDRARADPAPDEPAPTAPVERDEPTDATPRPPRRVTRGILTALGAVALLGLGIAIGFAAATQPAPTDATASGLPELAFVQTSEDVISGDILSDSGIDPASIRYIATIRDFRIYLAVPDDGDGRCIAVFTSTDNRPWSAGCASGAQPGAAVFGVDENLSVAIGDPADDTVAGTPIRLSDSVTAYVRPN